MIEDAIEESEQNRLAGLDHIIETKAVELLMQNPFLTSNDDRVEEIRGFNRRKIETAPVPWFNIYPTYFETQRVFPRFLAIVLLSDKWDRVVFDRNRRLFDKCRERGIYMAGYWLDKNEIDAYEI